MALNQTIYHNNAIVFHIIALVDRLSVKATNTMGSALQSYYYGDSAPEVPEGSEVSTNSLMINGQNVVDCQDK
jgi:hypothetical protein